MTDSINWDNGWIGVTDDHRKKWKEAYPTVNIQTELNAMDQWLWSNPRSRKKNYARFVVNWLRRCQQRGGASNYRTQPVHCSGNAKLPPSLTKEEIERRTRENEKPGGACDQIDALLSELRNGRPHNQN